MTGGERITPEILGMEVAKGLGMPKAALKLGNVCCCVGVGDCTIGSCGAAVIVGVKPGKVEEVLLKVRLGVNDRDEEDMPPAEWGTGISSCRENGWSGSWPIALSLKPSEMLS